MTDNAIYTPYKPISGELFNKLKNIKLLLSDVDGVLSDGKIYLTENGDEIKSFNAKDGFGITAIQRINIPFGVITGRTSKIVEKRMTSLKVKHIHQGVVDKVPSLIEIAQMENITLEQIAYIGDDVIDISIMEKVGLGFCPKDAHPLVKNASNYICENNGGDGAVREVCDLILLAHNSLSLKGASI